MTEDNLLSKIYKAWESVELPVGRKSDMDITENELHLIRSSEIDWSGEEVDVERYFQGKIWKEVEPYNEVTRYIPLPLNYMNHAAALYYSQCYLRYFVEHVDEIYSCDYGYIDKSFSYFREYNNDLQLSEGDFHKLKNITAQQIEVVEEVTNYILPYVNLANILIGSNKNIDSIETINTSYKKITTLHKKIKEIEGSNTSESGKSQINYYKSIIDSYENIIASYEQVFTSKAQWKLFLKEKFSRLWK